MDKMNWHLNNDKEDGYGSIGEAKALVADKTDGMTTERRYKFSSLDPWKTGIFFTLCMTMVVVIIDYSTSVEIVQVPVAINNNNMLEDKIFAEPSSGFLGIDDMIFTIDDVTFGLKMENPNTNIPNNDNTALKDTVLNEPSSGFFGVDDLSFTFDDFGSDTPPTSSSSSQMESNNVEESISNMGRHPDSHNICTGRKKSCRFHSDCCNYACIKRAYTDGKFLGYVCY